MYAVRATILLLALQLLSRCLGIIREIAIAWRFGASASTDAYFVAFSIPNAFYVVVGTSLTAVIVPLLAKYEAQGQHHESMRVASLAINVVLLFIGMLALGGILGASKIAWALGGGFSAATLKLTTQFTALMMPSIVFLSVAGVMAGLLNCRHIFGPPALGPIALNLVIILGALLAGAGGPRGMLGLVIATVLGSVSFAAIQLFSLRGIGYRHRWTFDIKDPVVKRIFNMLWPVVMLSGFNYLYTIIDFRLASAMTEGSITALNYASKLIQLPQGLFAMAVTTAIFPALSKLVHNAQEDEMASLLVKGLRVIIVLAAPAAVGLAVIGEPLIQLLFQRGAFGAQATTMTSSALLYMTIGLIGFCLNIPLIRAFYALQDLHTPLFVGLFSVGVKFLLSLALGETMKHNGLALATSIAVLLNASILALLMQRRLQCFLDYKFFIFARNVIITACLMGGSVYLLNSFLTTCFQSGSIQLVARLAADIVVGTIVFLLVAWLFRVNEVQELLSRMLPLLKRLHLIT